MEIHDYASPPHPVTWGTYTSPLSFQFFCPLSPGGIMDFKGFGDIGSGCEDENSGLALGSLEDCPERECQWEESRPGLVKLVCVTAIYIPLMLFGLLGNVLTILVVWLRPHMRSSTYLYLSSMAVSDLLILLLLPVDLYKLWRPSPWPFGDLPCKLTMFMSECCTFCTILHITFLSIERYIAVCWPIVAKTLVTRRRTRALIGCLWLGAAVSAAPVLVIVGVEEVGREELGLGEWRNNRGWTGSEGEQGGFIFSEREGGSGNMFSVEGGLNEIKWGESIHENIWLVEDEDRKIGTEGKEETKQGDGRNTRDEGGGLKEEEAKVEGMQYEGGGLEARVEGGWGVPDNRECRFTDYAFSSGLLSAMMIVSNLYFLVPLCILALVYSLIGRTLWLRPQSSRREQSHRHTVKMLGVIVLAFVLCWLPYQVGRTISSLSQGRIPDGQEAYPYTDGHVAMSNLSEATDRDIKPYTDTDAKMHTNIGKQSEEMSGDLYIYSHTTAHTRVNRTYKTSHFRTGNDSGLIKRQYVKSTDNRDAKIKTHDKNKTSAHNNTQVITNIITQVSESYTKILMGTRESTQTYRMSTSDGPPVSNRTSLCINPQTDLYSDSPFNNHTLPGTHYLLYHLSQYYHLLSSLLLYVSAAVNPLLYNLMSARYRHAVHSLIHSHAHTQPHRRRTLTGQHSTTTL